MTLRSTLAALACCAALPLSALAQEAPAEGAPAEEAGAGTESGAEAGPEAGAAAEGAPAEGTETPPPGGELSVGEALGPSQAQIYVREEHGDWEVRCIRAPEGQADPCQLFQRLSDQGGNPVVDVNVFHVPDGGEVVAGATVITPLETLLTAPLTMRIDGGEVRRYPYAFCDPAGCYVRIGLREAELAQLRRGAAAEMIVVPALAPDQQVIVRMSLSGFTAGMAAIEPEG
jgi:invasion protein IalB